MIRLAADIDLNLSPGPPDSWPPLSTIVPSEPELMLPTSATCGRVLQGTQGRFQAPRFPRYAHNLDCAWVIKVPPGYNILLQFPTSGIENR